MKSVLTSLCSALLDDGILAVAASIGIRSEALACESWNGENVLDQISRFLQIYYGHRIELVHDIYHRSELK